MKLSEYMAALTAAEATGEYVGRDMVFAMDCSENGTATSIGDYAIAGPHVEDMGATLNPTSEDKSYIAEGDSTIKTSTKRSFTVTGQRLIGDTFQDFVCSFAIKYGKGSVVQRPYVYFHAGTKKGESGVVTILVKKDGAGAASATADIEVELQSCAIPVEYTYTATPAA